MRLVPTVIRLAGIAADRFGANGGFYLPLVLRPRGRGGGAQRHWSARLCMKMRFHGGELVIDQPGSGACWAGAPDPKTIGPPVFFIGSAFFWLTGGRICGMTDGYLMLFQQSWSILSGVMQIDYRMRPPLPSNASDFPACIDNEIDCPFSIAISVRSSTVRFCPSASVV